MNDQAHDLRRPAPETSSTVDPAPDGRTPRRWRGRLGWAAGILAGALLIGAGVTYWLQSRNWESTDDAQVDAYTTQMGSQAAGRVTELLFTDNQHVSQGQVLLRIDPREYQAKLEQARAQSANAHAQLEQARAQVIMQQANVEQAEANVLVADADLTQAQQDFNRYRGIDPHAVTRQQIDSATATFRGAQAKLTAARQSVNMARAQVQSAEAQVLGAQSSIQQADANVDTVELQLSYCTIRAPVAGTIGNRTVSLGNYVSVGQPLFALVQDGRWVTANFKETQLARMRPGQPAEITIDAVPGETFHGRVESFQPGTGSAFSVLPAENATGNYVKIVQRVPVKLVFDDPGKGDHQLSPGMSVVPSIRVR